MIKITAVTMATLTEVTFSLSGDATVSTCAFDLSRAPFNLDFKGNPPLSIASASFLNGPNGVSMTAVIGRAGIITLTFSAPLPNGSGGNCDIILAYGGIS